MTKANQEITMDYATGYEDCLLNFQDFLKDVQEKCNGGRSLVDVHRIYNSMIANLHRELAHVEDLKGLARMGGLVSLGNSLFSGEPTKLHLVVDNREGGR